MRNDRLEEIHLEEVMQEMEVPESKGESTSGVFEVKVTLPNGGFSFTLVKGGVFQNASPTKLTRGAIMNGIKAGLRPLLGEVVEK